jgi:Fe-S-cluster containining protein
MPQEPHSSSDVIDAGPFGVWLDEFLASLRGRGGTTVPCGDCRGCCISSYSILVRPEDVKALAVIPAHLLTNAPALGAGVKAMGYLPDGTCPMLRARECSIYEHRPQTCRDYDCRVFAAAGIDAGEGKVAINTRVRAWRFTYEEEAEREAHRAVRSAAAFMRSQGERFPEHRFPKSPSGIAVLAVKSYAVFLGADSDARPAAEIASAVAEAIRAFDTA